jgi:hypothetical protein
VGRRFGRALQGFRDHFFNALIVNLSRGSHPRFIEKPIQTSSQKSSPPKSHGAVGGAEKRRHSTITLALVALQNDLGAKSDVACPPLLSCELLQFDLLCRFKVNSGGGGVLSFFFCTTPHN